MSEKLEKLLGSYLQELPDKLATIDNLWRKVTLSVWNDKAFKLFHSMVHGIAGTAGSFGLVEVGEVARSIDIQCRTIEESGKQPDSEQREAIRIGLESLNRQFGLYTRDSNVARRLPGMSGLKQEPDNTRESFVYVLDDEPSQRNLFETLLENKGYRVQTFADLKEMEQAIAVSKPNVIVMDIMLPEGSEAGLKYAARLKQGVAKNIPVLFTSARADLAARLKAVRAGGDGYFPKPVDIDQMAIRIRELIDNQRQIGYRILIVDDDKDTLSFVTTVLNEAAMSVVAISNPIQVVEKLTGRHFDLIILDMHMPDVNGLELAKMIRQCGEHASTPIIFLSAETDPELQAEVYMMGADEFVQKPVKPDRLLRVVRNRISRMRPISKRVRYLSEKEPVTGLFNRQYFFNQLDKAVQHSQSGGFQYATMVVDIDNYMALREQTGADSWDLFIAGIAHVIDKQLPDGAISAYVSEHMIGILFECEQDETVLSKAEQIRVAIKKASIDVHEHPLHTTCSIGIARIDKFTPSVADVMNKAERACEIVRKGQGDAIRLFTDDATQEQSGQPDKTQASVASSAANGGEGDSDCEKLLLSALSKSESGIGFFTVYQPIAHLSTESEEKYDVLLRLRDSAGKEVLPSRFLPIAEKYNLLVRIDYWVLEYVLSVLSERVAAGVATIFFIKLDIQTINDDKFINWLQDNLAKNGVSGKRLVLQVTETTAKKHLAKVTEFANQVKQLGCGFALEHFGTQLDSDQMLGLLPIDYIKIDGAYMTDLGTNNENRETVSRIASHALERNIFAIASFVEDADSLAVLWACGVNYMQGNYVQLPDSQMEYDFQRRI